MLMRKERVRAEFISMTKEQEDKVRKLYEGKSTTDLVQVLMLLKISLNTEHAEFESILGLMNQLILESMQPKS